jgi:hypothetical protein
MDAFIYFEGLLLVGLDQLEQALDDALGDFGEVSGTGTGEVGSNIDVTIEKEELTKDEILTLIRNALSHFQIPKMSKIVINGDEYSLT